MTIDEDTLKKWMNVEVHEANRAIVTRGPRLRELVSQEEPTAEKRNGEIHRFDPDVIDRLQEELSALVRVNLRLPITVYFDHTTDAGAYLSHEWAIEAVEQLDLVEAEAREGKLWLSRAKAMQLSKEWPTVFQFLLA